MAKRNIIKFEGNEAGEGPGIIADKKPRQDTKHRFCTHQKVWLDEDRRKIQCRNCKVFFEPYDWIVQMVKRHLWKFSQMKETQRLIDEATANLTELMKEETNAKARLRQMLNKHDIAEGKYAASLKSRREWRKA